MPVIRADILSRLSERASIIKQMNAQGLDLNFLREFGIPELTACCGGMWPLPLSTPFWRVMTSPVRTSYCLQPLAAAVSAELQPD